MDMSHIDVLSREGNQKHLQKLCGMIKRNESVVDNNMLQVSVVLYH